ncbi:MAG: hypothetical protein U0Q15_00785 [Kineosporiaceae bacterium]
MDRLVNVMLRGRARAAAPAVEFCDSCVQVSTPSSRAAAVARRAQEAPWRAGVPLR